MKDDLDFFQMEDDLIFLVNGIFKMEDNLNILVNGKQPQIHSNGRQPQYS